MKTLLALILLLPALTFAPPDIDETKALAEQGDSFAQYNLGVMYANGVGVPEYNAEAVKWWRLAAELGEASAQFSIGLMYAKGGVVA